MSEDIVFDKDDNILFEGTTHETVEWLEGTEINEPMWVWVGNTNDILTHSQYLDLAT